MKLLFALLIITIGSSSGFAKSKGTDLDCKFLGPIEQAYVAHHVKFDKFDTALQDRTVEQYVKRMDPTKVYFLKSDVEQVKKSLSTIFDKIKNKDCAALVEAQNLLKNRVAERADFAKKFLGASYKFDSKVEFNFDTDKRVNPADLKEANDLVAQYVHYQIATYLSTGIKIEEAKTRVIKNWDRSIKRMNETSQDDVYAAFLDSFAKAFDPHSSFMAPDDNDDFSIHMSLSLEGIGATLSSQDGFTTIEALVPGGAAARSGLVKPQDKIIAVAQGEHGQMENVIDEDLKDVVKKIRGPKGTVVRLMIMRNKEKVEIKLVRDKVKLEDDAASISYVEREVGGKKKTFAVLNLPAFYADPRKNVSCAADMKKLVAEAKAKNVDGMVLDLSTNSGGSLDDAVKISGLFFQTGNVVKQSGRADLQAEVTLKDQDPAVDWNGPLVILTSRMSASASEIVSGTLQDYKRAVIVGNDHTFGKGTVQTVQDLPNNLGAIKVTIGMFFTPGGSSTQHKGVDSDIQIPGAFVTDEIGEKTLDYSLPPKKLPSFLSEEANVTVGKSAWLPIKEAWIKSLADKSKERVSKNKEFQKITEELEKAKAKGKVIKLAELVNDKESKKKLDKQKAAKNLSKKEKLEEYLKRPDLQEAVNVLGDLIVLQDASH